MKNVFRTSIQSALTLMVLAACSPAAQLPTANTPQNQPNQTAAQSNTQNSAQASSQTSAQASAAVSSASMAEDMTALHEDEAIYRDAVLLFQSEAGFATQALGNRASTDARLRLEVVAPVVRATNLPGVGGRRVTAQQASQVQARAQARLKQEQAQRASFKAKLKSSGAITVNADNTLTIDPVLFKQEVAAQLKARQDVFKSHLAAIDARLDLKHEVAKEKMQKLRHRDYTTRTSDTVSVTNADGSVTETVKIQFKNSRLNISRETVLAKTSLDGKILKVEFKLTEKTPAFEREVTRIATHNADGSKNVLVDAKTTWKNGRVRERHEERVVNADGSATGAGTVTVTLKDGTNKTYTFNLSMSVSGEITSDATEPASNTEVIVTEETSGAATVIVNENNQETVTEVNLEAEAEADAQG